MCHTADQYFCMIKQGASGQILKPFYILRKAGLYTAGLYVILKSGADLHQIWIMTEEKDEQAENSDPGNKPGY